jgi:hypothetical protein
MSRTSELGSWRSALSVIAASERQVSTAAVIAAWDPKLRLNCRITNGNPAESNSLAKTSAVWSVEPSSTSTTSKA